MKIIKAAVQKMAIQMNVKNSLGRDHAGHMAIDAVRYTRTPTSTHAQHTHIHKEHTQNTERKGGQREGRGDGLRGGEVR